MKTVVNRSFAKQSRKSIFLVIITSLVTFHGFGQACIADLTYAVHETNQRDLYTVDPATGNATFVADLFASAPASSAPSLATTAIALDNDNNTIWYITRNNGPRIYSYNLNTGVYGGGASISGFTSTTLNINKAAFNPIDHKFYFHCSTPTVSKIWAYDPTQPNSATNPQDLGSLTVSGRTFAYAEFSGGDFAFDGSGNLVAFFSGLRKIVTFPATHDGSNNYTGFSTSSTSVLDFASLPSVGSIAAVSFLSNGTFLVGFSTGFYVINTNTGSYQQLSNTTFGASDLASCAAPLPNVILLNKSASIVCSGSTASLRYTTAVTNTGSLFASNTILKSTLPAGLTVTSGTLNGVAISGLSNSSLSSGILIKSPGTATDGILGTDDTAKIVLEISVASNATYSNQDFLTYSGSVRNPLAVNGLFASDDTTTVAVRDATSITISSTACSSLPVKLTDFSGKSESGNIKLSWKTSSEVNTREFIVEHAFNNNNFSDAGTVVCLNRPTGGAYNFNFAASTAGKHAFRLRITDNDGKVEYSKTIVITISQDGKQKVMIYPNPVFSNEELTINGLSNEGQYTITDATGRVMKKSKINLGHPKISINEFAPGIYFFIINDKEGKVVLREKIIRK